MSQKIKAVCLLLLSACSSHTYVTGVSRSYQPYCIKGQYYCPQHYYDYCETGYASWYGPGFHGRKTASGQVYNQYTMTAAHRTLPLPSIVRVRNLCNDKEIIVLVKDRGPFIDTDDRIIDLSYKAAQALGIDKIGVAPVEVECLTQESQAFADFLKQQSSKISWMRAFEQVVCEV